MTWRDDGPGCESCGAPVQHGTTLGWDGHPYCAEHTNDDDLTEPYRCGGCFGLRTADGMCACAEEG